MFLNQSISIYYNYLIFDTQTTIENYQSKFKSIILVKTKNKYVKQTLPRYKPKRSIHCKIFPGKNKFAKNTKGEIG